ncbi:MAG: YpdA family putative bacillithiol disulfide reductase [Bacteroidota bacterium]
MMKECYDVIIVGAGPIGMTCAIEAQRRGLQYLVIEKGVLVNSIYNFPTNMTFFSTSKKLEIGGIPFISHNEKPTRREALEYFRRVNQDWKLNINFYEKVLNINKLENEIFDVHTSKGIYKSKSVVVVTGFYDIAKQLDIEGEELPKVKHYYDDWHPYIGQKVVVVGAANSACDVALELYHKGAEVTMVVRKDSISPRVKYWIKPNIENRIKEGSIKAFFNSTLTKIEDHQVQLQTPEGKLSLANDFVLAMTGYEPDYTFFKNIGIEFEQDGYETPVHNAETLETNVSDLYIAGVINAGRYTSKLFIENTRHHAKLIINAILEKQQKAVGNEV